MVHFSLVKQTAESFKNSCFHQKPVKIRAFGIYSKWFCCLNAEKSSKSDASKMDCKLSEKTFILAKAKPLSNFPTTFS